MLLSNEADPYGVQSKQQNKQTKINKKREVLIVTCSPARITYYLIQRLKEGRKEGEPIPCCVSMKKFVVETG